MNIFNETFSEFMKIDLNVKKLADEAYQVSVRTPRVRVGMGIRG